MIVLIVVNVYDNDGDFIKSIHSRSKSKIQAIEWDREGNILAIICVSEKQHIRGKYTLNYLAKNTRIM